MHHFQISQDEELEKMLERENLLASLAAGPQLPPGMKFRLDQSASKKKPDIFSQDIDAFTSSAEANAYLRKLQTHLMDKCIPRVYGRSRKRSSARASRGNFRSSRFSKAC